MCGAGPRGQRTEAFGDGAGDSHSARIVSADFLFERCHYRRVLLQFRIESGLRMVLDRGWLSDRSTWATGRSTCDRVAHTPVLHRDAIPATVELQARQAPPAGPGLYAGRERLGQEEIGRQRAGIVLGTAYRSLQSALSLPGPGRTVSPVNRVPVRADAAIHLGAVPVGGEVPAPIGAAAPGLAAFVGEVQILAVLADVAASRM